MAARRKEQARTEEDERLHADCTALSNVLELVGNKWAVMVVGLLGKGPLRFTHLRAAIGCVSGRSLTITLRRLADAGLVSRTHYPELPLRVEYALTPYGRSLETSLAHLLDWARRNQSRMPAVDARK